LFIPRTNASTTISIAVATVTAANASLPSRFPTQSPFTSCISDCSRLVSRIGRVKRYSLRGIDPTVKSSLIGEPAGATSAFPRRAQGGSPVTPRIAHGGPGRLERQIDIRHGPQHGPTGEAVQVALADRILHRRPCALLLTQGTSPHLTISSSARTLASPSARRRLHDNESAAAGSGSEPVRTLR